MFPENFLAQLQDNEIMYVKNITAHYSENTELFMYEPTNGPSKSHREYCTIKLKSNTPGYVLTSLLNIDFEDVEEIIADLGWNETADEYSDIPTNYEEIYRRLLSVSDVFSFYLPDEWDTWQDDLTATSEGIAATIAILKRYIAFCDRRQVPYSSPFFTFLVSIGFFGVDTSVITPVEEITSYAGQFDADGEIIDDLDEIYDTFLHGFDTDNDGYNRYIFEPEDRLSSVAMISFNEIASRRKSIQRCQNCGKYFIPAKRVDTLYCDNPSPEAPEMTCKEYGTRRLWYERQKEDELATLSRKIASAKGMLAKRNPDIPAYAASYEYFKAERMIWKKAVDEGHKTKEEYREWLLLMQSQKVIKEAASNPG